MSCGERSCLLYGSCPKPDRAAGTEGCLGCNVDCEYYKWDGKTEWDSVSKKSLVGGRGAGKTDSYKAQLESLNKPKRKPYKAPTKNQAKRLRRKRKGK